MLKRFFVVLFSLLSFLLTVLSWLFPDPLSTGFFTLSYHKILIASMGLGATLMASLIWFILLNNGASFLTRVAVIILFGLTTIAASIGGYQLGAPSYAMEGVKLTKPKQKVSYGTIVEEAGVVFRINGCQASGALIRCELELKSRGMDRNVRLNSNTHVIDENGNRSDLHRLFVAEQEVQSYRGFTLVADLKTTVYMEFNGFSKDADYVALLKVGAGYSDLRNEILMRRIEVVRFAGE